MRYLGWKDVPTTISISKGRTISINIADDEIWFIAEKYDKLIVSLRTAQAKEYSLDKEYTSYSDLLDALRLSLKGYKIK